MNLQKPATMFSLILLSGSILSGFAFQDFAYAETGMEVSVNADEGSTTISVSGHTSVGNNDVTVVVKAPNGNIVSVYQVSPDSNGDFMKDIQIGGAQWKQDGMYTIDIQQGTSSIHSFSLNAEVNGGTTAATSVSQSTLESGIVTPSLGKDYPGLILSDNSVLGSTTISVSGNTDRLTDSIQIVVTSPNGNIVSIEQIEPDAKGDFMFDIEVGGSQFVQNGLYTVAAQQGQALTHQDSIEVDIIDGAIIPEFDTIAAMILSVAIISIIAVTAKTRLSLVPRH